MNRFASAAATACAASALVMGACETRPAPNEGRTKTRPLDTRIVEEDGLASKDLVTATDDMVARIAADPRFRNAPDPVIIVMDRVVNATASVPNRNFDIYLARIRARLAQTDASTNIRFSFPKTDVVHLRRSEGLEPPTAGPGSYASSVDYALTSTFYDLPSGSTDTYLLTFQIVDIRSGEIAWEGMYEVKFR